MTVITTIIKATIALPVITTTLRKPTGGENVSKTRLMLASCIISVAFEENRNRM